MWSVAVAALAFVAMEPITAATHRWVMHGIGWALHRSHHRQLAGRVEANDAFPVAFAAVVCTGFAVGFNVDGWGGLVPVGVGITLYGLAYAVVHDVYIHGRLSRIGGRRIPLLDRLAAAHRLHHRFNGAPYGMLLPVVPARVRERVAAVPRA
jgi:beta-carotene 3-hydroxylase